MEASGATLSCTECGKSWYMDEYGQLEGDDGRTEFSSIQSVLTECLRRT
jgi:hypothetical protein